MFLSTTLSGHTLGPTNPCSIANHKEPLSTTFLKAKIVIQKDNIW